MSITNSPLSCDKYPIPLNSQFPYDLRRNLFRLPHLPMIRAGDAVPAIAVGEGLVGVMAAAEVVQVLFVDVHASPFFRTRPHQFF